MKSREHGIEAQGSAKGSPNGRHPANYVLEGQLDALCNDVEMTDAHADNVTELPKTASTTAASLTERSRSDVSLLSKQIAGGLTDISGASSGTTGRRKRNRRDTIIRIVAATYGPSDGRRLLNGEMSNTEAARVPYTRDVLPFLRALLETRGCTGPIVDCTGEMVPSSPSSSGHDTPAHMSSDDENHSNYHILVQENLRRKVVVPIMDGKSMNAIFGDPCPGTTKCLRVSYVFHDEDNEMNDDKVDMICRSSFQEHERVVLRRMVTFYQDEARLKRAVAAKKVGSQAWEEKKSSEEDDSIYEGGEKDDVELAALRWARRMGRSQSLAEMADAVGSPMRSPLPSSSSLTGLSMITEEVVSTDAACATTASTRQSTLITEKRQPVLKKWRLRSATSEIVLPITLPYLDVRQRALCQLVCKCWRFVVRESGVAQTVDVNDPSFPNFTRSFLRGIMAHSYSSLQSLFLNDFTELSPDDLHPAIPHLRKLRILDITRCQQLNDTTLVLLSQHVAATLQVLYMKGICRASDEGVTAVCRACHKLRVFELSNVPITDESGLAIGENLGKLEALYMRDNFQLTNRSVDVITERCTKLSQLTLWGCTRMRHLKFGASGDSAAASQLVAGGCDNLILLNLWGCHSLLDEAASSMVTLQNLRTLIVGECHRLTDSFVINLAQAVPHLQHLHLRYVRRITDASVNAIANTMNNISSLDLSFCTRITPPSLANLLEARYSTLCELRLFSCRQLDMTVPRRQQHRGRVEADGAVGQVILEAIKSHDESCLNILDVRECKRQSRAGQERDDDELFLRGMASLKFEQKIPFFFVRPARWNTDERRRLVQQMITEAGAGRGAD